MRNRMNVLGLTAFALLTVSCVSEVSQEASELTSETLPVWELSLIHI